MDVKKAVDSVVDTIASTPAFDKTGSVLNIALTATSALVGTLSAVLYGRGTFMAIKNHIANSK